MNRKCKSTAAVIAAMMIFSSCADTNADTADNEVSQTELTEQTSAFPESVAETTTEAATAFSESVTEIKSGTEKSEDHLQGLIGKINYLEEKSVSEAWRYDEKYKYTNGSVCFNDFNADGCPEMCFYGGDMLTAYLNIWDISGDDPVFVGGTAIGEYPEENGDCISLYYDKTTGEYFYFSCAVSSDSSGGPTDLIYVEQFMTTAYFDGTFPKFSFDDTREVFETEEEAETELSHIRDKLSGCELVTRFRPAEYCGKDTEEQLRDFFTVRKNIDIDKAYAEMLTPEEARQAAQDAHSKFPKVSEGNIFIDFDYIKEYSGSKDTDEAVSEAAVQCLKESEYYSESLKNKELILADKEKHKDSEYADWHDQSRFYNENGELVPIVSGYFPEDYDGDGALEYFVLVSIPQCYFYDDNPQYSYVRDYLIYVRKETDNTYRTEIMGDYTHIDQLSLLDYGAFKQLIIGGYGLMGADDHDEIFGVINEKAECLYGFRGGFVKTGCFLGSYGWQGMGETMYYDTVKHCYQTIGSVEISKAKVLEMDSTGIIRDKYGLPEDYTGSDDYFVDWYPVLIGNKYYCITHGPMDCGSVYVYENGAFKPFGEWGETAIRYSVIGGVIDIDMGKALEEMISPEEAANK